ncbi:MAG: hypothetical protein ABIP13_00135, partial [Tepidiformaceae bacterium]
MDSDPLEEQPEYRMAKPVRRRVMHVVSLGGWGVVLALQTMSTLGQPTVTNVVALGGLATLFILVNLQILLIHWSGRKTWRRVTTRLHGSAYLNNTFDLPNRNYLLS